MPHKTLEKRTEYAAAWRSRNRDKLKAWRNANKEKIVKHRVKHRAKYRDKYIAYSAAYRAANYEHLKSQAALKRPANRKKEAARVATYYRKNRDKVLARQKEIRNLNREKIARRGRIYRRDNPDKIRSGNRTRKARKRKATVGNTKLMATWEKSVRSKTRAICYWCKTSVPVKTIHVDHIVALSNGGDHEIGNLCVSCPVCNLEKHSLQVSEWNHKITEPVLF